MAARAWQLRRLTARELLLAREEARRGCGGDEAAFGLWCNAAVLARALTRRGRRRFSGAAAVLAAYSAQEIAELAGQYAARTGAEQLTPAGDPQAHEAMLEALAASPYERLKWRVLRTFGALPGEARAREMTDADYLYCALHLTLDGREALDALCPECRARAQAEACPVCGRATQAGETGVNAAFDPEVFAARRCGDAG